MLYHTFYKFRYKWELIFFWYYLSLVIVAVIFNFKKLMSVIKSDKSQMGDGIGIFRHQPHLVCM